MAHAQPAACSIKTLDAYATRFVNALLVLLVLPAVFFAAVFVALFVATFLTLGTLRDLWAWMERDRIARSTAAADADGAERLRWWEKAPARKTSALIIGLEMNGREMLERERSK